MAEVDFFRSEFSKREWRVLMALRDGPADGFVGVTGLIEVTGLPGAEVRRVLNRLERDGIVTHTVEQRPVKVWRIAPEADDPSNPTGAEGKTE